MADSEAPEDGQDDPSAPRETRGSSSVEASDGDHPSEPPAPRGRRRAKGNETLAGLSPDALTAMAPAKAEAEVTGAGDQRSGEAPEDERPPAKSASSSSTLAGLAPEHVAEDETAEPTAEPAPEPAAEPTGEAAAKPALEPATAPARRPKMPPRKQRPILYSDVPIDPSVAPGAPKKKPEAKEERAPKSSKVAKAARRWVPIVLIGLLLAGAGAGAAFFFLVRTTGGPTLTSKVPRDVDIYIEVPSLPRLAQSLATMRFIDDKKVDMDHWVEQAENEVADTLDISDNEAKKVLESVEAVSVAARVGEDSYEGALLIRFGDSKAARIFLSSERFFEADEDGVGGKRYLIDREPTDKAEEVRPDPSLAPAVKRSLFGVRLQGDEKVAWFKEERLVVLGHDLLLDDVASVLKGKLKSLDDNERFQRARKLLPRDVAAFGYVDTQMFEALASYRDRDKLDYILKKPEPIVASLSFEDAGSRFSVSGGFSGKMVPPAKAFTEPASLTLHKRLPEETVAFFSLSTKLDVPGSELETLVLDQIEEEEPKLGKNIRREIASIEKALGFRLTSIYDALGDEAVVAVMPYKAYKLDLTKAPNFAQDFGVAYIQQTEDADGAARVVRKIRSRLFNEEDGELRKDYRMRKEDDGGFTAEPNDPIKDPFLMARFSGPHLMMAAGRREVCERFWDAFTEGKDNLGGDEALSEGLDALPANAHARAWVDTGRVFGEVLDANPGIAKDAQQFGFDTAALKLTGDNRVTSGLALGWTVNEGVWTVDAHSLNATWMLPIAAYVEYMQTQMRVRTYQARNTVKAIAAAANAAYRANRYDWRNYTDDTPDATERLCKSATPVPAGIPKRASHTPDITPGKDWNTGDDKTGWKCLKFSLSQDMYYRYTYTVGGGFKGPARGGPDPGPNGFEVAAEGDLDGDGKTSLFTMTGSIDPSTGALTLASAEFASDELE